MNQVMASTLGASLAADVDIAIPVLSHNTSRSLDSFHQSNPKEIPSPGCAYALASDRDSWQGTNTEATFGQDSTLHVSIALDVFWTSAESGVTLSKRLPLDAISGVSDLRGLFRQLLSGAFPSGLPYYLTSREFYKFAPAEEFASFPGDAIDTKFRLIASCLGWEVTIAERDLGNDTDPERRLLITVAEFESEPVELSDGTEVIATMVTYPTVSVQRVFLDQAIDRLRHTAIIESAKRHPHHHQQQQEYQEYDSEWMNGDEASSGVF